MIQLGYVSSSLIMPPILGGSGIRMPPIQIDEPRADPRPDVGSDSNAQTNFFGQAFDTSASANWLAAMYGSSFRNVQPWLAWPGNAATYRTMLRHPTIALARAMIIGAILGGKWTAEVNEGGTEKQKKLIERCFIVNRDRMLPDILRGRDFGWAPFEIIWKLDGGKMVIDYLKPLLPDDWYTQALVLKDGRFIGVRNSGEDFLRGKGWAYTFNRSFGNPYGESVLENVRKDWSRSEMLDDEAMKTAKKIASIIPIITHPKGQWKDAAGVEHSYRELASNALYALQSGQGFALETVGFDTRNLINHPELAKLTTTNIEFHEVGSVATSLGGFTDRQRYYDSRIFRGMLVPERAGMEGQFGTKAEADSHGDVMIQGAESLDKSIAEQLTEGPVADVLRINFGEAAVGKITLKAAPLRDSNKTIDETIISAILKNPGLFEEWLDQIDVDAITKRRGVPVEGGKRVEMLKMGLTVENQTPGAGMEDEEDNEREDEDVVPINGNGNVGRMK